MTIEQKYEWQTPRDDSPAIAVHRKLGREVAIHHVSLAGLTQPQRQNIRDTAGGLAKLDHPAIPCLIDFIEEEDDCYVVVESYQKAPNHLNVVELLDELQTIEQLTDSLVYAKEQGIVHGNLDRSQIGIDALGDFRLLGLGLQQLNNNATDLQAATRSDLRQVTELLQQITSKHRTKTQQIDAPPSDDSTGQEGRESLAAATLRQAAELDKLTDQFANAKDIDIASFHLRFREWLHHEQAKREAKKLSFTDVSADVPQTQWYKQPAILAVIGVCFCALLAASALLLWPKSETPVLTSNTTERTRPRSKPAPVDEQFSSMLEDDGRVFVDPNVTPPTDGDNKADEQKEKVVAEADPVDQPMAEEPEEEPEKDPPVETVEKMADQETPADNSPPKRTESPFLEIPASITLPEVSHLTPVTIANASLRTDEPLKIRLIGGQRTLRQSGHKIRKTPDDTWAITYSKNEKETKPIAQLSRQAEQLEFRWLPEAEKHSVEAAHLCNAAITLKSGDWQHVMALRQYETLPAISLNLERKKPYDFKLRFPPNSKDIMVEFLPNNDSLAKALPKNIISAEDGELKIGLDAGKNSLVMVKLKPRIKSRPSLLIQGSARPAIKARFVPIKKGAANGLRADAMRVSQSLFQLRSNKSKAKDDQKKFIEAKIKSLEKDKERLEDFIESYKIAASTKLNLRIFRQIGPHRIPLVQFGEEP